MAGWRGGWVGAVPTFWYDCPVVVLACGSLHACSVGIWCISVCVWRCELARFRAEIFYAL